MNETASWTTLDYASIRRHAAPAHSLHTIARFCGIAPLCAGVSIYLLYLLTRWEMLPFLGLAVLVAGAIVFVIGIIHCGIYGFQTFRARPEDAPGARRNFVVDLVILLLNFPVAAYCADRGSNLAHAPPQTIVVSNESKTGIDDLTFAIAGGSDLAVGKLEPNESIDTKKHITAAESKSLRYRFKQDGIEHSGTIDPLPADGFQHLDLTIKDGSITTHCDDS